jgi:glycosyltransferase involved in cell wall biosynthesis
MKSVERALYIDALALVPAKKSGVGVTLMQTLDQLLKLDELKHWQIYLVVPLGKAKYLEDYIRPNVSVKTIFLPARALELLSRINLLPPVDWFLGKGIYLFPNYRNWPVWHSRSITYVYDVGFIKYPETVQLKNRVYLRRYIGHWMKGTDRVVTISSQVRYEIEKYLNVSDAQISVVPCGVDGAVFYRRNKQEVEKIKKRYAIPFKEYLLYVGNIEPRKNLVALLDAYSKLSPAIQERYGLVFIGGDGWLNQGFYEKLSTIQSAGLKALKVAKYVSSEDLPALYSGAALLVHPAIYEGFGITPLEAMACGTPVAVSDVPSIREVVQNAGHYFDPHDPSAISRTITAALKQTDDMVVNVAEGLELAKEFSWKHSAIELSQVLSHEQQQGYRNHPLLARLRYVYQRADRDLMRLLGERVYPPYEPGTAATAKELSNILYDDFLREQPSRTQALARNMYLGIKHLAAVVLKKVAVT